jgi:hypothetical protein
MKVGDLIKLCEIGYPQYKRATGVLVELRYVGRWIVMINGVLHPYVIDETDMVIV